MSLTSLGLIHKDNIRFNHKTKCFMGLSVLRGPTTRIIPDSRAISFFTMDADGIRNSDKTTESEDYVGRETKI